MEEFMKINSSMKVGIISGVIGSMIFFIFFQPLLIYSGSILNKFISLFFTSFNDSIYIAAATRNSNASMSLVLSSIFGIIQGIVIAFVLAAISFYKNNNSLEDTVITETEEKTVVKKSSNRKLRILTYILVFYGIALVIFSTVSFYNKTTSVKLIYSFEQDITILRAYVSDEKLIKISSEWGLMKTEEDYLAINNKLIELAKLNGVKLPN